MTLRPLIVSWLKTLTRLSRVRRQPCGAVARHRPHVRGHGDLEELQIIRGAELVVAHAARDEQRPTRLKAQPLTGLEFQFDPALHRIKSYGKCRAIALYFSTLPS